jgi:hypothetical protein
LHILIAELTQLHILIAQLMQFKCV